MPELVLCYGVTAKSRHCGRSSGQAACYAMNVKWENTTPGDLLVRASTLDKLEDILPNTGS